MVQYLEFHHVDGGIRYVKERTIKQIYKVLQRSFTQERIFDLEYLGNQHISECNGNIYADFLDKKYNIVKTLYIADYYDYINEIKE